MLTEMLLPAGATLHIADSRIQILSVERGKVEFAITSPTGVTVRVVDRSTDVAMDPILTQ